MRIRVTLLAVGLAASLAHRGVRLVRVATTTLSQADSAIGVKNGVNAYDQKNYLGVFDVPWAVVNDEATLATLDDRDWRAGFSEAVKVALLKGAALFDTIARDAEAIRRRNEDAAIPVIQASAKHHFDHITRNGDPFERDRARPLDFGHWAAHRLEQMTGYDVRHGEAVSIGLALDTAYARLQGWLPAATHDRILACLRRLGLPIYHAGLDDTAALAQGIADFREHLGGELTIPMVRGIGQPFDVHTMDADAIARAAALLAVRAAPAMAGANTG